MIWVRNPFKVALFKFLANTRRILRKGAFGGLGIQLKVWKSSEILRFWGEAERFSCWWCVQILSWYSFVLWSVVAYANAEQHEGEDGVGGAVEEAHGWAEPITEHKNSNLLWTDYLTRFFSSKFFIKRTHLLHRRNIWSSSCNGFKIGKIFDLGSLLCGILPYAPPPPRGSCT